MQCGGRGREPKFMTLLVFSLYHVSVVCLYHVFVSITCLCHVCITCLGVTCLYHVLVSITCLYHVFARVSPERCTARAR